MVNIEAGAFDTRRYETKWQFIARPTTPRQIFDRLLGSFNYGKDIARQFQHLMQDKQALLALNGSFLVGFCQNPTEEYFGNPIDVGRVSDVDLIFVDQTIFDSLPQSQIIHKPGTCEPELLGQISHGIMDYDSGKLKKILDRKELKPFADVVKNVAELSGNRFIDFKFCRNREVLRASKRPFYVMADQVGIYIQ